MCIRDRNSTYQCFECIAAHIAVMRRLAGCILAVSYTHLDVYKRQVQRQNLNKVYEHNVAGEAVELAYGGEYAVGQTGAMQYWTKANHLTTSLDSCRLYTSSIDWDGDTPNCSVKCFRSVRVSLYPTISAIS